MKKLPRILVIDDMLALLEEERADFCVNAGLSDATNRGKADDCEDPIAEAEFCSGLKIGNGVATHDLEGTLEEIRRGWTMASHWALILLDLHFSSGPMKPNGLPTGRAEERDPQNYFGLQILDALRRDVSLADLPIVIMSAMERKDIESRFARHSPAFVRKPLKREKLARLLDELGLIEDEEGVTNRIVGHSIALLKCLRDARTRARKANSNILILGERGTGKELIAQYIHRHSGLRKGKLVTAHIAGMNQQTVSSELFGHVKGSFTNASETRRGMVEEAEGGTLFIDEFGDLSSENQSTLIRFLDPDKRSYRPVGGRETAASLQVVLATNKIDKLLDRAVFREDLLDRIDVESAIKLPPLRERKEDIESLATQFVRNYENELGVEKDEAREIDPASLRLLVNHDWPDNIRGLRSVLKAAVDNWKGVRVLLPEHLSVAGRVSQDASRATESPAKAPRLLMRPDLKNQPNLDDLILLMKNYRPELGSIESWKGRLDILQEAYALLLAQLVKVALEKERDAVTGEMQHTPAMKLLLGRKIESKNQPKEAYRMLKRLLGHHEPVLQKILRDNPDLKLMYEKACEKAN